MLGHVSILREISFKINLIINNLVISQLSFLFKLLFILSLSRILLFSCMSHAIVIISICFRNLSFSLFLHILHIKFSSCFCQQESPLFCFCFLNSSKILILLLLLFSLNLFLLFDQLFLVLKGCSSICIFALFLMSKSSKKSIIKSLFINDHPSFILFPVFLHRILLCKFLKPGDLSPSFNIISSI